VKSKILLTFGDSWPAGAKLDDKSLAFPKLLASKLEIELMDLSEPATSIDHVVMAFLNFLENTYKVDATYTALFCLTDVSRAMAWRNGDNEIPPRDQLWAPNCFTQELQINNIDPMSQTYFKNIHSTRLENYTYHKNIVLLKLLCEKYSIRDFYVHNFYDPNFEFKIVNKDRIYPHTLTQLLDTKMYKEYIPTLIAPIEQDKLKRPVWEEPFVFMNPDGHPTELGHQRIAEELAQWIN